ncbi:hypothetical protein [Helicobacter mustelae]|uniref:Putative lipoprotein n=1 Tax=Helicobacter mustelae (strain ATCC 43772 / CCUG 25715 / CIP 103759 / LMG 18044 / NCTC 12198 / R85-136P) TaxID=679897 RepID=D3UI35_HELM1|nr:hypothetical protein [Helicobacter mustelae]CBG40158.1 putative lipoprotein [Helicobacter mustelae 12198]SQH71660.1 lipoprotein [Helicobacter mustelae]STP12785.1 lipoprotein [Helicobacter mustelae]
MRALLFIGIIAFLIFEGCSQRKDFVPKKISGSVTFNKVLPSELEWSSRNSVILKNGEVISKSGGTLLKLQKNSRLLNENDKYYMIMQDCQHIELIDKVTQKTKKFPTRSCAFSANMKDHFLAFVLIDNSYGIYDINTGEMIFSDRGSSAIAVDSLNASPAFLDTLVVFPTLDGQISGVSLRTKKLERTIIVHSEKFFSNVIFLDAADSRIFAATPKRLITLVGGRQFDYEANIRDVKLYNGYLYVLTLEGKILQLDATMRVVNELSLPFAVLSGIVIEKNKLYTMERLGYLIEVDLDDFQHKTYTLHDVLGKVPRNKIVFYNDSRIYYDRYYLDFSRKWKKKK